MNEELDGYNAAGLPVTDALLCVACQGEGKVADADVGLDALGFEVVDRAHRQAMLDRAKRLLDHPQAPVARQQLTG